jgi:F-type H+-transporting ATPase subunit c
VPKPRAGQDGLIAQGQEQEANPAGGTAARRFPLFHNAKEVKDMLKRISTVVSLALIGMTFAVPAFAQEAAAGGDVAVKGLLALAAGFAIAIAAGFGAMGQSRGLAAALEGIARNPAASGKLVTPMIIGLAMIESLVIYALVIALMIVLKL